MKRVLLWLTAGMLLLSLASCKQKLEPSPYGDEDFDTSGEVVLSVEYPVYDKSVATFNYAIANHTEEELAFGQGFSVEMLVEGVWKQLPQLDNIFWEDIAYLVEPGGTWSNSFSFWQYDFQVEDGQYRLIKQVGERLLCAPFSIGASDISNDTPYGYTALEDLPAALDPADFDCDLATDAVGTIKAGGQEQVAAFLEKVAAGTPAMLRLVSITREGDPVLYDVIFENDHFLYRVDRSRDQYAAQEDRQTGIYEQRYSYLVTDGEYVYLSDYASLDCQNSKTRRIEAGSSVILCLDNFQQGEDLSAQVEAMTARRLADNSALARYWSADGACWVNLTEEKNSFAVSTKNYGVVRTLPEEAGEAPEIYAVQWLTPERVQLMFTGGAEGKVYRAVFDMTTEKVVFIEAQS